MTDQLGFVIRMIPRPTPQSLVGTLILWSKIIITLSYFVFIVSFSGMFLTRLTSTVPLSWWLGPLVLKVFLRSSGSRTGLAILRRSCRLTEITVMVSFFVTNHLMTNYGWRWWTGKSKIRNHIDFISYYKVSVWAHRYPNHATCWECWTPGEVPDREGIWAWWLSLFGWCWVCVQGCDLQWSWGG